MGIHPLALLAGGEVDPAGGAPTEDLIPAAIVAVVLSLAVGALTVAHRSGRFHGLDRLAGFSERVSGLPGWASLPNAVAGGSLFIAGFGFYWDVSTHIDNGRDAGPFANPAHFFILAGLGGIAFAGMLALILGTSEEHQGRVRLAPGWHVPLGGVLMFACGSIALLGFPLDDVWHRIFGQDVTLWGPTHIQMIAGASLTPLAAWLLHVEGSRTVSAGSPAAQRVGRTSRIIELSLAGAFLIGLSTLQAEFDFGVPQFSLLYHPVLLMLAAGIGLVTARVRLGPGGAFKAVAFYLAFRAALTLIIGPGLGRITLHFPLYLVEALVVELVALRVPRERQLTLGLWAGIGIGTVGLLAEWGWSHLWMPIAWPANLMTEALPLGLAAAVAGGVLGGMVGRSLAPLEVPRQPVPRPAVVAAGAVAVLCLAYPMPTTAVDDDLAATVALREVQGPPQRQVEATITIDPPSAADDARWLNVTAWQGAEWRDRSSIISELEQVGPGTWRSTEPIPVHGNWKALVRLHEGRTLASLPIFLPEDPGIPAEEVAAPARFDRSFVSDKSVVQREYTGGAAWLEWAAYLTILAIGAGWIWSIGWGLARLEGAWNRRGRDRRGGDRRGRAPRPAPAPAPAPG